MQEEAARLLEVMPNNQAMADAQETGHAQEAAAADELVSVQGRLDQKGPDASMAQRRPEGLYSSVQRGLPPGGCTERHPVTLQVQAVRVRARQSP